MNDFATLLLSALVSGIIAGGSIVGIFWHAFENKLSKTFARREGLYDRDGNAVFATLKDVQRVGDKMRSAATRDDLNGLSERLDVRIAEHKREIDRNAGLFVQLDDRTGDLEEKVARIDERQTQQWERISEQMASTAETTRDATRELRDIARTVQELTIRLEGMRADTAGNQH